MKVVFTGSHGSGKTVTSTRLAEELKMHHVPEGAREVLTYLNITEDLGSISTELASKAQEHILDNHKKKATFFESFIADRGVMDVYAYSLYWLSRKEGVDEILSRAKREVEAFSQFYNLVILVPPRIPLIGDGVRDTKYYFRETIHHLVLGILRDFGYKYEILQTEKLEDRIEECKGLVQFYNARSRVWGYSSNSILSG